MLTFFRRIRKSLLSTGAAQKYLLYAIGEIALVVIGILIALQINNWNEWRKDRIKEIEVLKDLEQNLSRNSVQLNTSLSKLKRFNESYRVIYRTVTSMFPYSDSLDHHFYQCSRLGGYQFTLSKGGYESLKNAGFDIITNEVLKDEILYLYEEIYPYTERIAQFAMDMQLLEHNQSLGFLNVTIDKAKPKNFDTLLQNDEFLSFLNNAQDIRTTLEESEELCHSETQRVLQLIKEELGE